MAIRTVRTVGDAVLEKKCREVKAMTPRIEELIDDMFDTMYENNGVGLAAPQVGVLRRVIVVDTGDDPRVLINPVIVESDGEQTGEEGCLSYPGKYGIVTRPMHVVVEARDFCHEIDHLDGKMYMELVEGDIKDAAAEAAAAEETDE